MRGTLCSGGNDEVKSSESLTGPLEPTTLKGEIDEEFQRTNTSSMLPGMRNLSLFRTILLAGDPRYPYFSPMFDTATWSTSVGRAI